ncbi:ribonuclease H-like domain-containing protein [Mycena olivaceomarginata]|nr:ribonuclease H-like domain-containing protein [Mycena olivaceomarginata]
MKVPTLQPVVNPGLSHLRASESEAYLDVLLRETLASKQTPEDRRAAFYGPVYGGSKNAIKVYTDGSCYDNGLATARAGARVYFGQGSPFNASVRVTGQQTNQRGELLVILYALSTVPPDRALEIYSDSEYSIRSIFYWAPSHAEKGWRCANADLLRDIVSWMKFRSGTVDLKWVKQ